VLLPASLHSGAELDAAVESSLRAVNLWNNSVADKQARQYSGGMKRRLSVAISFFGDPLVVYLDEPSTVSGLCIVGPCASA
jgi:ABC-type multidrug transport system ATPase subunit